MRGDKGPDWSPTHNQIIPVADPSVTEGDYDWKDDARKCYRVAIDWMHAQLKPDLCICGQPKREPIPEGSHYVTYCCRQVVVSCCGE